MRYFDRTGWYSRKQPPQSRINKLLRLVSSSEKAGRQGIKGCFEVWGTSTGKSGDTLFLALVKDRTGGKVLKH